MLEKRNNRRGVSRSLSGSGSPRRTARRTRQLARYNTIIQRCNGSSFERGKNIPGDEATARAVAGRRKTRRLIPRDRGKTLNYSGASPNRRSKCVQPTRSGNTLPVIAGGGILAKFGYRAAAAAAAASYGTTPSAVDRTDGVELPNQPRTITRDLDKPGSISSHSPCIFPHPDQCAYRKRAECREKSRDGESNSLVQGRSSMLFLLIFLPDRYPKNNGSFLSTL